MFKLFSARAVTNVLAFIVISPYCIQIIQVRERGRVFVLMCVYAHACAQGIEVGGMVGVGWGWGVV